MRVASRIKQALASIGYYRGCLARAPYHGVAVLTYHAVRGGATADRAMQFGPLHVTATRFESHCAVLRDLGCSFLSLAEWHGIATGSLRVPFSPVMLTFDDGYRSVLTEALPILERFGIPALVFVCTGPVDRGERFWYDALAEREGEAAVAAAKAGAFALWRESAARTAMPAFAGDPHAPLGVDELRQLAGHPLITIGAHTVSHPILARASPVVQAKEVGGAKTMLEGWIGRRVDAFAYPNGWPGADYDERTIGIVRDCGFTHAFTTAERFAVPSEAALEHPRFTMLQDITAFELAHRLAITWPRVEALIS
ncbi:MAG: polysaccharide deacetylase family protein [Vicinamibacterales bacterium]